MQKKKARTLRAPGLFVAAELGLVDVVLLPVERGVGLDDDVLVRGLFELIDELEQNSHKHIIIQSDATLHWEQYDIY